MKVVESRGVGQHLVPAKRSILCRNLLYSTAFILTLVSHCCCIEKKLRKFCSTCCTSLVTATQSALCPPSATRSATVSRSHDCNPAPLLSLNRTPRPSSILTFGGGRCWPASAQRKSQDLPCSRRCKSFKGHIVTAGEEQLLLGEEESPRRGRGAVIEEQSCRRRKLQVLFLRWEFGKSLVGCS